MFGSLGGPELVLILVIALIVFGPRRLPEIGKNVGKMLVDFRRASNDFKRTIEEEVESEKRALNAALEPVATEPSVAASAVETPASPATSGDDTRPQPDGTVAHAPAPPPTENA